ncbi:general stress protein [Mesobacillus harenae]|uniref:general stress protein n=1 Tax=Mesobacillus harenae TaxID=2213203 RepID=UPI0030CC6C07
MAKEKKRVVGSYETEREAISAVEQLKADGYRAEDISVISKNHEQIEGVEEETGTKTEEGLAAGAATGGVLGGLTGLLAGIGALAIPGVGPIIAAGPIAATLSGAAVGVGAGGLAGALVGMGIPEEEAEQYEEDVKSGNILVLADPQPTRSDDSSLAEQKNVIEDDSLFGKDKTTLQGSNIEMNTDSNNKNDDKETYPINSFSPGEMDKGNQAFRDNADNEEDVDSSRPLIDNNIDSSRPLDETMLQDDNAKKNS